jgi:hypothetical protein
MYYEEVGFFSEIWYKSSFQRDEKCQKYVKSAEKALSLDRVLVIPIKPRKESGNQTYSKLKLKQSQG